MDEQNIRAVAVVDDDEAVLESYQFLLELAGLRVVTFSSADAFLQGLSTASPYCLILDQHMPGMTGLELVQRLQADGRELPVMLVTAAPNPAIRARAAELGIGRVLEKPPEERDLLDFVIACG